MCPGLGCSTVNLGRIDCIERPPHGNGTDDKMIYAVSTVDEMQSPLLKSIATNKIKARHGGISVLTGKLT